MPRTVKTPPQFDAIFDKAEDNFGRFFQAWRNDPTKGSIEISGERFVLVRGAALSIEFFEIVKRLFTHSEQDATGIACQVLFDIGHAVGKADASHFHKSMGLSDPISKLSAGPIYFAHAGWAFVDISEKSNPEPNENYYLLYDHPYSFEADAWIRAGKKSDFPVCVMNAGYSSGWCEESFGIPLVATELSCRARGDEACRFIMAPPDRIEAHVADYLGHPRERADNDPDKEIWRSFRRDWAKEEMLEKALRNSESRYRTLFEISPDAVTMWDMNSAIQAVNRRAVELLGYEKPEDLIGKSWHDLIVPEDLHVAAEPIERVAEERRATQDEFRMKRKTGVASSPRAGQIRSWTPRGRPSISSGRSAISRRTNERRRRCELPR
jgi:PAS domain S-box-containing protein